MRCRHLCLLLFVCALVLRGPVFAQTAIQYVYDELGRLVGVIDQYGDAAAYQYDPVGNLLSITRTGPSTVSIIEVTPNDGGIGGTVTIYGTGFSTTPSQNTVTFNGTTATVVSATSNKLVVTIPTGATSGSLVVTTPSGSSSQTFVITAVATPTITNLSPTIGAPGTSVTVTGTAFEPTAATNNVSFNVTYASLGTVSTTSIAAAVPGGGTSGRIAVATPRGTAVSTQDFFVPPAPSVAGDVAVADRLAFSTDRVVSLGTAGKIGLLLFDLTVGQRASLNVSSGTTPLSTVSVLDPYGRAARTASIISGGFLDTITAAVPGTYTILVDPASTYTGNNTLRLYDVPADATASITPGGSAVGVTTTVPGQNGALTFAATAGQRVSVRTTSSTFFQGTVAVVDPTGQTVGWMPLSFGGGFLDVQTLPTAGPHKVFIDPYAADIGSVTATLYDVPADVSGTISIGGASFPVDITAPGQNGLLTFSGTVGQRVSLTMSSSVLTSGSTTIRKPDGSTLASAPFGGTTLIEPVVLPTTGTYSIFVDPILNLTGTVTLTLNSVPSDITGTITPGGSPVGVTITAAGQKAFLTFSGTSGQRVSLQSTTGPTGFLNLLRPDGMTLASTTTGFIAAFMDTKLLPSTGTYTIVVDPSVANTGSITVTLHDVPADVTGSLTIGGSSVGVTITVPGQNGSLTFSGAASQQVTVHITSNTIGGLTVKLLRPDGTTMTQTTTSSASFNLTQQTLTTTGTYTVAIDPGQASVGSLNVQVTSP